ncbi:hypothetical protein [Streptomyces sp. WAC 06738]|uniref:hypothetical protein n=1 Tax=Streptomyces sp. WAC 06738 TaxID=2203210 RepID=UPI0013E0B42F|nr:hypothetical protein [Streptomyces sp. WAC 06738]
MRDARSPPARTVRVRRAYEDGAPWSGLPVAARDGAADTAAPSFDDYYPAQRDYVTSLT